MLAHHLASSSRRLDEPGCALGVLWTSQIYLELPGKIRDLLCLVVIEVVV